MCYPDPTDRVPDDDHETEDPILAEFGEVFAPVYYKHWQQEMDNISAEVLKRSMWMDDKDIIDWLAGQIADLRARAETHKTEVFWAAEALNME